MEFEKIEEAINKMPQETKDLLFSEEIGQRLQQIIQDNNLEEEQSLTLVDEVGYVIMGLKDRAEFLKALAGINIQPKVIASISKEINDEIFSKIHVTEESRPQEIVEEEPLPEIKIETAQEILPMLEEGEKAHDTTPEEKEFMHMESVSTPVQTPETKPEVKEEAPAPTPTTATPVPKPVPEVKAEAPREKPEPAPAAPSPKTYPPGQDPYREPLN